MSIEKLMSRVEEVAQRERRRDPMNKPRVFADFECNATGITGGGGGFAPQQEYQLQLRLAIRFWANSAQHDSAKAAAEAAMKDFLYRDVCSQLTQLRSMLHTADREALELRIIEIIGELR